ncbi:AAA family ATPase [Leptotrichia sp. oral taxon 218]|jgi:endopeptidase La|uniref:S16 family serine protease n=1 Tax=Leptotrichia sp. oral taxon 218 TaxID=712361 RepID=UPI001B8B1385|nr:S16 family serine protease [Leptotrichia sp. oral taxon 218]QUB95591.1 AAA family ATPase [Leptotrichia sp. oral taxon 218]
MSIIGDLNEETETEKEAEEIKRKIAEIESLNTTEENKKKLKEYVIGYSKDKKTDEAYYKRVKDCLNYAEKLDWKKNLKKEKINISKIREFLNKSHYGMEKVKETILENLALRHYMGKSNKKIPIIICLAGSAGVGKTSIVEAIAKGLGKKFEKVSLSGISTAFELTGLTKSYSGSAPGRIIKTLAKCGCDDPLILLDEIDKTNKKNGDGDIEGVLLEILDPDQNKRFRDEFLELEYDLSNVMFVATANDLSRISAPLKSRMEIICLEDYNLNQKVEIAKKYLVPSINKNIGSKLSFSDDILRYVIQNYTNEAGVRKLKTILLKIYGKIAKDAMEKKKIPEITLKNIDSFISADKIPEISLKLDTKEEKIGKVLGMGVTPLGGKILPIQTAIMPGNGKIIVTGNLSEVMKEGINVAVTYLRTKTEEFHLKNPNFYKENDIHVHFSENAIPKDGPSAGITIVTSILSALNKVKIKQDVAFTGEITILGEVLPVGGVDQKIEGAYKLGIKKFFIPKENENYIKKLDKNILDKIKIELVDDYEQIYSKLFMSEENKKRIF